VKIASAELASTPVNVPSRTLGAAARELSAFVSLVTGFRETPTAHAAVSKAAKNDKKEELSALPMPARLLPEMMALCTKPAAALELPALGAGLPVTRAPSTPGQARSDFGSVQRADVTANLLVPAVPALSRIGDLAFALRLTPNHSETVNDPPAVNPAAPPGATNSTSNLGANPFQTGSADLEESITLSDQLRVARREPPAATAAPLEQTLLPGPFSGLVRMPKNPGAANAWSGALQPSVAGIVTTPLRDSRVKAVPQLTCDPHLTFEPQLKSEARGVAADGSAGQPRGNPDAQSEAFHSEPKQSRTEAAVQQESQEFRLSDNHAEGSGKALAVQAWPLDSPGAPDTRGAPDTGAGSAPTDNTTKLKVESVPEMKIGLAPPLTRQIWLNLSTDDSTQVNIGFTERAGKVLVAVRTADHELAQSLRTDLGDLVGRLEGKGFKTETWTPSIARQEAVPLQSSNTNSGFNPPQHPGSGNRGGQQRQRQDGSTQRQKARWAAQIEKTISANEPRSES
jgi:hypothetical protein